MARIRQDSVYDSPSYRASEAAHLLLVPESTKAWCFGQGYRSAKGDAKTFRPVIEPADAKARLLSFANLCELHVLGAITRGRHRRPILRTFHRPRFVFFLLAAAIVGCQEALSL